MFVRYNWNIETNVRIICSYISNNTRLIFLDNYQSSIIGHSMTVVPIIMKKDSCTRTLILLHWLHTITIISYEEELG